MANSTSLKTLLDSLSQSLQSASEATPKLAGIEPPSSGISLLDVKNELLLSYLQNLVFLILLKIRSAKEDGAKHTDDSGLGSSVVTKLVELRLYLEKGVRPLEEKLSYQIERVLRAADDAERSSRAQDTIRQSKKKSKSNHHKISASESESQSEDTSADEGSQSDDQSDHDARPSRARSDAFPRLSKSSTSASKGANGVYRPPKIAPISMPTTERKERADPRPLKSRTMDEFIADELSAAPRVEPSIGTNIQNRGRHLKTDAERKEEKERQQYEEQHFIRLPNESKKERARKVKVEGRSRRMNFGGEEWRELGQGVDRINRLTKSKESGGGTKALLEKSRKRGIETVDGPRGSGSGGVEIGERYQKRLKVHDAGRRDRGKKRSR